MPQALVLEGFPAPSSAGDRALAALTEELRDRGWSWDLVVLRERTLGPCRGCFDCWLKSPGVCVQCDDGPALLRLFQGADLVAALTPVTFGGYSSAAKRMIDRLLPTALPFFRLVEGEVHHLPRYDRNPDWITLGVLPPGEGSAGAAEVFSRLFARNALNNAGVRMAMATVAEDDPAEAVRGVAGSLLEEMAG